MNLLWLAPLLTLAANEIPKSPEPRDDDRDRDGWTLQDGDCDDRDPEVFPMAIERCESGGRDLDCDGLYGPEDPDVTQVYFGFEDKDGDGFGDPATGWTACAPIAGGVSNGLDCDDTDPARNPEGACEGAPFIVLGPGDGDGEGSGFNSIQSAWEAAPDGATIWLEPGHYTVNLNLENRPLTLRGMVYGQTVLNGAQCLNGRERCSSLRIFGPQEDVKLPSVSIVENLVLMGGLGGYDAEPGDDVFVADEGGGNFQCSDGNVELRALIMDEGLATDPHSYNPGGNAGLFRCQASAEDLVLIDGRGNYGSNLYLAESRFFVEGLKTVRGSPSSIWVGQSVLEARQVRIDDGFAYVEGAGLVGWEAEVYLSEFTINRCRTGLWQRGGNRPLDWPNFDPELDREYREGGGLYFHKTTFHLSDGEILMNQSNEGGGLFSMRSNGVMNAVTFRGNEGYRAGGAILFDSDVIAQDVTFVKNQGVQVGGLRVIGGRFEGVNLSLKENRSSTRGGGMMLGEAEASLWNAKVLSNTTLGHGGGILLESSTLTLVEGEITGNRATRGGGGIWLRDEGSELNLIETEVHLNHSLLGEDDLDGSGQTP